MSSGIPASDACCDERRGFGGIEPSGVAVRVLGWVSSCRNRSSGAGLTSSVLAMWSPPIDARAVREVAAIAASVWR